MLVIARDLGVKVDKNDAFKGADGKYYSSEQAYQKEKIKQGLRQDDEHQKEMRKKCIDKMFDFMHYDKSNRMPTMFFGRLKIWNNKWGFDFDSIYETMIFVSDVVERAGKTKIFESDVNRLFYFMGIIQNSLNDGKRISENKKRAIEEAKKAEQNAEEINTDVGVSNRKGKIINLFGGDDEWM